MNNVNKTSKKNITPIMQQYYTNKNSLPKEVLLLFRLGDFYEFLEEDAKEASSLLGLCLTKRHGIDMAGIPAHTIDNYINKLLNHNKKVAICDQIININDNLKTKNNKKLLERKITRIFTPGTLLEDPILSINQNHYLLGIDFIKKDNKIAASWLDLSTGSFSISYENENNLLPLFYSISPKEVIFSDQFQLEWNDLFLRLKNILNTAHISEISSDHLDIKEGSLFVMKTLNVLSLQGFGIEDNHPALGIAGRLLMYAKDSLCKDPKNISTIKLYIPNNHLLIDPNSLINLEIFHSYSKSKQGSLINAIDKTKTMSGSRLLHNYLEQPLLNLQEIQRRQDFVSSMVKNITNIEILRKKLTLTRDIERILSRLQNNIIYPREIGGIKDTINILPTILQILKKIICSSLIIVDFEKNIIKLNELKHILNEALTEDLPQKINDGGVIKKGYDMELDNLLNNLSNGNNQIFVLEEKEKNKTGIKNLKIKHHKSFGYYFDISNNQAKSIPNYYIRKQTTLKSERFSSIELKNLEKNIINWKNQSINREMFIIHKIITKIIQYKLELLQISHFISEIDVFSGWAVLSNEYGYTCPNLNNSSLIDIQEGRHPVVEQMLNNNEFIPNNTVIDSEINQIHLITGPNMAGKSTYIRQIALLVIMAQIGCWVPAKQCTIGIVDKIFSRIGASDELSKGKSTFMVEMSETANILNNFTKNSLIILDELGRGTSTYDGMSIACAVLEYLHNQKNINPKTLFATHYHEITSLNIIKKLNRLKTYSFQVQENNGQLIFLRKIIHGVNKKSYGIQVAKLAGVPPQVIKRATEIMSKLFF